MLLSWFIQLRLLTSSQATHSATHLVLPQALSMQSCKMPSQAKYISLQCFAFLEKVVRFGFSLCMVFPKYVMIPML